MSSVISSRPQYNQEIAGWNPMYGYSQGVAGMQINHWRNSCFDVRRYTRVIVLSKCLNDKFDIPGDLESV